MSITNKIPTQNLMSGRTTALRQAVNYVDQHVGDFEPSIFPPQGIG